MSSSTTPVSQIGPSSSHGSQLILEHNRKSVVDLRLVDYVSDFDRNLMCPICHCPFIEPVRLICDHTFCRLCLDRTLRNQISDTKTCPTCRCSTTSANYQNVPRFLIHMIDELMVKCPSASEGCELHLKRGDLQVHVELYCPYTNIACPSPDCDLLMPRKDYSKGCLHQRVTCGACSELVMERELEDHRKNKCIGSCASCRHCGENIPKNVLSSHIAQCPEAEQQCIAAGIGCHAVARRADIARHEENCVLAALAPTISSMQRRLKDQDEALKIMRHKNDVLEGGLAAVQSIIGEASSAADTMRLHTHYPENEAVAPRTSSESAPFDSATHHLLSLHEALREEIDRVTATVSEVDARSSMMIMNETLRIKEDMSHTNAVVASMRMQLQWLTSAKLQSQPRATSAANPSSGPVSLHNVRPVIPGQPTRRSSDPSRQDTKL